ncbi:cytidylyltransferase domain-containing protein [Desulfosporosinus sp. SYSU MS00001]|uniref:cytidylyltransferase domain-containing protein n=1 Tax=Desulfosporosinus sp. SYSU MS00001 TaxID=3416284 RepID=UPI003CFB8147
MKTVIIVQARMTSTRLPGKVLKTVMGKPLLEYLIERLRRVKLADEIVIATTTNTTDQPILELCRRLKVPVYRGSELDVLARYHGAAEFYQADAVVRVTSDCPVIDPGVIDQVISFFLNNWPNYDYVSNRLEASYPRGMDTEIFSYKSLNEAFLEAQEEAEREHVTPFMYWHSERYKLGNVAYLTDESCHRWTVDTQEDFELIRRILESLYPDKPHFTLEDILNLLQQKLEWLKINAHVKQKVVDRKG